MLGSQPSPGFHVILAPASYTYLLRKTWAPQRGLLANYKVGGREKDALPSQYFSEEVLSS